MGYKDPERQREYQREWIRRRRDAWINANGPCQECGSTDDPEVDHVDPATKLIEPAGIWSLTAAKREVELAKCQVLCRRCHAEKTRAQLVNPPPHGTIARYRGALACRCDDCRAAHCERQRAYRAQTAA